MWLALPHIASISNLIPPLTSSNSKQLAGPGRDGLADVSTQQVVCDHKAVQLRILLLISFRKTVWNLVKKKEKKDVQTRGSQVRLNGSKSWDYQYAFRLLPMQDSSVAFDDANRRVCYNILGVICSRLTAIVSQHPLNCSCSAKIACPGANICQPSSVQALGCTEQNLLGMNQRLWMLPYGKACFLRY